MNAPRARTSGLAILAVASSLVFCLPLGVVLGIVALLRIHKSDGKLAGRGLAVAGIVLSLLLNVGTYAFMTQVYPVLMRNSDCFAQQLLVGRELSRVQKLQSRYRVKHQRYGSLAEIGYKPASDGDAYAYQVIEHSDKTFLVRATAHREGLGGDTWELDQSGIPRNVYSGCIQ
jgi:hypothetical protein